MAAQRRRGSVASSRSGRRGGGEGCDARAPGPAGRRIGRRRSASAWPHAARAMWAAHATHGTVGEGGVATTHGLPAGRGLRLVQTRLCPARAGTTAAGGGREMSSGAWPLATAVGQGSKAFTFQPLERLCANNMNHRVPSVRVGARPARYGSEAHNGGIGRVSKFEILHSTCWRGRIGRAAHPNTSLRPDAATFGPGATGAVAVSATAERQWWLTMGRAHKQKPGACARVRLGSSAAQMTPSGSPSRRRYGQYCFPVFPKHVIYQLSEWEWRKLLLLFFAEQRQPLGSPPVPLRVYIVLYAPAAARPHHPPIVRRSLTRRPPLASPSGRGEGLRLCPTAVASEPDGGQGPTSYPPTRALPPSRSENGAAGGCLDSCATRGQGGGNGPVDGSSRRRLVGSGRRRPRPPPRQTTGTPRGAAPLQRVTATAAAATPP